MGRPVPVYLAIALALAPQLAMAQNKCVDANGRITYQQDMCPGGVAPTPAREAAEPPPALDTTRVVPPESQSRFTPARCEQMARDLAKMRGLLGSFPAPQRANFERQLVFDERTYKQECLPK
jgi:hypothetical protein